MILKGAVIFILIFLSAVSGLTAEQKSPDVPKPSPTPAAVIPPSEVATKAAEVSSLLRKMSTVSAQTHEIATIERQITEVSRDIDLQLTKTQKILQELPSLETLQSQQQLWQGTQRQVDGWLGVLTRRAIHLGDALNQLADLQKIWILTRASAKASKASQPILQQISLSITALETARSPLQAQRTAVLDLQGRVGKELTRCETVLGQIAQVQEVAVRGIFRRDRPPIWNSDLWLQTRTALPVRLREVAAAFLADIHQYAHDASKWMWLHVGVLVGLTLLMLGARRQVGRWALAGEGLSFADKVFDRPYAAGLFGFLIVVASPISSAPDGVQELCRILGLAPMIRLILPVVHASIVPGLYALAALFAVDAFRHVLIGGPLVGQLSIALEALAGIIVLGQFLHSGHLRYLSTPSVKGSSSRVIKTVAGLILFISTVGLFASILGYVRLAGLLISGVLAMGIQALVMYAFLQVARGATAFALRAWPLRLLQMVRNHRNLLESRVYRLLLWVAIFGWIDRYLDYIGFLRPALSLGNSILSTKLELGTISITPGDILAFFLTVWVAYLLSAFIRFVLQEDVYPRLQIAKGKTYAMSSLLHYVIIALGLLVGLAALGVNLSKVTILVGALGVGIGFGLQSVINNFVSGLILLFESPIHVGDTVELGDLAGEVRRIGIRSSIIHTWRGADIIVPNAQLVTERVTNWTLSDQLRCIDLPVGVNHGAEPQKVIEVMEAVAAAHSKVLKNPAPKAFFVGYGDSSINFELRAW
ncbi:MAG TPA: hypothetical protein DEO88_18095, partial [Syntrophobacteraceae bacterium]|nr:hypothetical protein [Syntrophobacteraceae bacterium]